jgi:hypothetical protein
MSSATGSKKCPLQQGRRNVLCNRVEEMSSATGSKKCPLQQGRRNVLCNRVEGTNKEKLLRRERSIEKCKEEAKNIYFVEANPNHV